MLRCATHILDEASSRLRPVDVLRAEWSLVINPISMSYEQLIHNVFGAGILPAGKTPSQIVQAFDNPQYGDLKASLAARMQRLLSVTESHPALRKTLIDNVKAIADASNWDGAYAELTFLDFLLFGEPALEPTEFAVDKTIGADQTLASEMGYTNANLDIHVHGPNVYLDVKVLSDKIKAIVETAIKQAKKKVGRSGVRCFPSYDAMRPYSEFQSNLSALVAELASELEGNKKPDRFESKIISGLSYQFMWKAGAYFAEGSYSPIEHGRNHHTLLFTHAKKFHRYAPCGLAFVHHPWFGEKLMNLSDSDEIYFSHLARCFFRDYEGSSQQARSLNADFLTSMTAWEASRHLSFVMFLKDGTVMHEPTLVFLALNPNALNPIDPTHPELAFLSRAKLLDVG